MLNYDYGQYQNENGENFDFDSLDPYQYRTAQVESQLGQDPHTYSGSNQGIYQWGGPERRSYGISDIRNPWQNVSALNRESDLNTRAYIQRFGRAPTPGQLYLMHQQGQAGGLALMGADPNMPATQAIGHYYRDGGVGAITGNGGSRNMTAGDFSNYWINKFENNPQVASFKVPSYNTQSGAPQTLVAQNQAPQPPQAPGDPGGAGYSGPSYEALQQPQPASPPASPPALPGAATAPASSAAPPPQPADASGSEALAGATGDETSGGNPAGGLAQALAKGMQSQPLQPAPMPQFQLAPHPQLMPMQAARLRSYLAQLTNDM